MIVHRHVLYRTEVERDRCWVSVDLGHVEIEARRPGRLGHGGGSIPAPLAAAIPTATLHRDDARPGHGARPGGELAVGPPERRDDTGARRGRTRGSAHHQ